MCTLSSKSVFLSLVSFKILGGFMKWALSNKTSEKKA